MRKRYQAGVLAALLSGVVMASDALAAHGGGRTGGHGGGHPGGHVVGGNSGRFAGGHVGRGFAAPVRYVPRAMFFAAPVAYFPAAYYPQPAAYYYDPSPFYYEAAPPPVYYEQPVQSSLPPGSYGPAARSGSAVSPSGPYAAQDALRYRFYCPDTRKYYPEVNNCASAWLKVVPDGAAARR